MRGCSGGGTHGETRKRGPLLERSEGCLVWRAASDAAADTDSDADTDTAADTDTGTDAGTDTAADTGTGTATVAASDPSAFRIARRA